MKIVNKTAGSSEINALNNPGFIGKFTLYPYID